MTVRHQYSNPPLHKSLNDWYMGGRSPQTQGLELGVNNAISGSSFDLTITADTLPPSLPIRYPNARSPSGFDERSSMSNSSGHSNEDDDVVSRDNPGLTPQSNDHVIEERQQNFEIEGDIGKIGMLGNERR